jgi:hypothetical protein
MFRTAASMLMLLGGLPCLGQIAVRPGAATLLEGRALTFEARTAGPEQAATEAWHWQILDGGPGTLDPATGHYHAPPVAQPTLVKVAVLSRSRPHLLRGEACVLVLPHAPFDLMGKVLGEAWLIPYSSGLPFRDEATGRRFVPGSRVQEPPRGWQPPLPTRFAGCGIPFTLTWPEPKGAWPQLLTYQEGQDWVRHEVTGCSVLVLTPRRALRRFAVEALERLPGPAPAWKSHLQTGAIHVRGMVPFAGLDQAGPAHADGPGQSARFQEPFGLATLSGPLFDYRQPCHLLVSDARQHVIRKVTATGEVTTPWGLPGHPGHRDTMPSLLRRLAAAVLPIQPVAPAVALFNRPTFLCPEKAPGHALFWERCLVADSGNHVLRVLHPDGTVETLAGVPEQAGHRDGYRGQALFSNPQGLAEAEDGAVYVADQGNGVIRRIAPSGMVTTLAGAPGAFGTADGLGAEARFTRLRGLALREDGPGGANLFVADGHAIRRISLPAGLVTTVLGVVDTPGFKDVRNLSAQERRRVLREPCLRDPCGLLATALGLEIVDQGNHCVRLWRESEGALATLLGDPAQKRTRWGLMRDGMPVPLDDRYAALEAPSTLAPGPVHPETRIIATGSCLGEITGSTEILEPLGTLELETPPATVTEPYSLWFQLGARDPLKEPLALVVHYDVEFREADGTLADHRRGSTVTSLRTRVEGQFTQRGQGSVVVRCVTEQGLSAGVRASVEVR